MTPSRHLRTLLIVGLSCSNLLVFAWSGYSLYQSRQQYELRAEETTRNIAGALDENISNSVEKINLSLRTVADELERQLASGGIDDASINAFLARQIERLPEVEGFRIADANGLVILGTNVKRKDGVSWADREYFLYHRDHQDRQLQVSKPRMGRVARQNIVGLSQRYNYPDGRFAGVISAPIAVEHFTRILSSFSIGPHSTFVLRDRDLRLISRVPAIPDKPVGQIGNTTVSPEFQTLADSGVANATFRTDSSGDGFRRTITFRRLSKAPMIAIVGAASEDYLSPWHSEVNKTAGMASGFLLLSLVLGSLLLRQLLATERHEQVLAEREAQLSTLVEAEPDAIQFKDGDGRWLIANSVSLKLFGLENHPWKGLTDSELAVIVPQMAAMLSTCMSSDEAAWASGQPYRIEETILDASGRIAHFDVTKVPLFDADNRRKALAVVSRDITERKAGELELEQHRRHLEALVEQRTTALMETEARASHILQSAADGLYGTDAKGLITFINPAGCAMLGYRAEQVIGQPAHALFHHSHSDGTPYPAGDCPAFRSLRNGETVRVDDEVYWHADGHAVPVMYASHPIEKDGKITGTVTSFVDMSAQRAAAQAREQALVAAENLARVRREFLANMSHEIRTPLNGVLGFAEIGHRNYRDSERARDAFAKIQVSGKRLLGIINDILDFSKIEAGKLSIEQAEVSLPETIDHAIALIADRAHAKQLALEVKLAPGFPSACVGDSLRMGQILLNLLSNAVKFTETGSVTLSASLEHDRLLFRITDTGIGMSEEVIGGLFNAFQQADASATRRFGGTGLGLAISKRLLELMGGEIRVESQPGVGSTFTFSLPYVPVETPQTSPALNGQPGVPAGKPLTGISVLAAEDEAMNRVILEENLIEDGARVVMVSNGREAVERILQDGREAYDVVLMDIQMPEMDGYEAARRIAELAPGLPVIAQTAHAFHEEREKCLAAGMLSHIAKPIDPEELVRVILGHTSGRSNA